jgi:hypothetical protein
MSLKGLGSKKNWFVVKSQLYSNFDFELASHV